MGKIAKSENKSEHNNINATYNAQFNILMESELNAISKLPPELATRAMNILEETSRHRMKIDEKIVSLEETNQAMKDSERKSFYFWSGLGVVVYCFIALVSLFSALFLFYLEKYNEGLVMLFIGGLNLLPKVIKSLKK